MDKCLACGQVRSEAKCDEAPLSKATVRVYIAGPYSQGDTAANVHRAIAAAEEIAQFGATPFIPHLTHFWHLIFPHPYPFWIEQDNAWLRCCDAVLRLPGASVGADLEVREARLLGLPVFGSVGECVRWLKEQ